MIIKSALLERALEVAKTGKYRVRIYTSDLHIFNQYEPTFKNIYIDMKLPCPCGKWLGIDKHCICSSEDIMNYQKEIAHTDPDSNYDIVLSVNVKFDNIILPEKLDKESLDLLKLAYRQLDLLPNQVIKIIKLSKTIAKLDKKDKIEPHHISEAIQYTQK